MVAPPVQGAAVRLPQRAKTRPLQQRAAGLAIRLLLRAAAAMVLDPPRLPAGGLLLLPLATVLRPPAEVTTLCPAPSTPSNLRKPSTSLHEFKLPL